MSKVFEYPFIKELNQYLQNNFSSCSPKTKLICFFPVSGPNKQFSLQLTLEQLESFEKDEIINEIVEFGLATNIYKYYKINDKDNKNHLFCPSTVLQYPPSKRTNWKKMDTINFITNLWDNHWVYILINQLNDTIYIFDPSQFNRSQYSKLIKTIKTLFKCHDFNVYMVQNKRQKENVCGWWCIYYSKLVFIDQLFNFEKNKWRSQILVKWKDEDGHQIRRKSMEIT